MSSGSAKPCSILIGRRIWHIAVGRRSGNNPRQQREIGGGAMHHRLIKILAVSLALGGCGTPRASENETVDRTAVEAQAGTDASITGVSEDEAHDRATDTLASMSFDDVADASMCTGDCEGHDAGFQWAKENGYTDASSCSGDSQSFIEGCEAYGAAFERQVQEELKGETGVT